jgi:hypothetical protein
LILEQALPINAGKQGRTCPLTRYLKNSEEEYSMRVCCGMALVLVAGLTFSSASADDGIKSGPDKRIGGPFDVKAITGENKGRTLCYV